MYAWINCVQAKWVNDQVNTFLPIRQVERQIEISYPTVKRDFELNPSTPKGRWGYIHSETKRIEDYIYGVWNEEERRAVGDNLGYKMIPKWILENSQQNFEK